MIKIFRVELSLLAWALLFVAVGFYFMDRSAHAGESNSQPANSQSKITHVETGGEPTVETAREPTVETMVERGAPSSFEIWAVMNKKALDIFHPSESVHGGALFQ